LTGLSQWASKGYLRNGFGRLIRVGRWRGDTEAAIYVVAEADPTKAIDISRSAAPTMATILKI
jgi:hypothetical protein